MSSAAQKVFDLPELLELILRKVRDPQTMLFAQRVSKNFQDSIKSSIHLQRLLWLAPKLIDANTPHRDYIFNHLVDTKVRKRKLGLNRYLKWNLDKDDRILIDVHFRSLSQVRDMQPGSWQDMLVAQPTEKDREIVWCLGFLQPDGIMGRRTMFRLRQVAYEWTGGYLPTLGELREALLEKFGDGDVDGQGTERLEKPKPNEVV